MQLILLQNVFVDFSEANTSNIYIILVHKVAMHEVSVMFANLKGPVLFAS